MNLCHQLHNSGQRLWLDNITRSLLSSGTFSRYMENYSVTGLTSNPSIFEKAIKSSLDYDIAIQKKCREGTSGETLFFELALEDLGRAAQLLRPVHEASDGLDGWVSLEISPLLANNTAGTVMAAMRLHARARCSNLLIKVPGTTAGIAAIEDLIFAGVPVNVTLLFSREHYLAAAEAYMRGIERRMAAGFPARVASVASIFVSRWDVAVNDKVQSHYRNRLGIAIAMRTYKAYRDLLASPRWSELAKKGARPQRLLWASTGTKDPQAIDTLYVEALAAADTINTVPEKTLLAFAQHGRISEALPFDAGDAEAVIAQFNHEGMDDEVLAATLQREGIEAFAKSWRDLMNLIASKSLAQARPQPA